MFGLTDTKEGDLNPSPRFRHVRQTVRPGVAVSFHRGASAAGPVVGAGLTAVPLLPGQSTVVTAAIANPDTPTDYFATSTPRPARSPSATRPTTTTPPPA